jgi:hypothetical protein
LSIIFCTRKPIYFVRYLKNAGVKFAIGKLHHRTDLSLVAVNSEKFKQRVHTLLVMEELCRKVAVKELHAIPNGL